MGDLESFSCVPNQRAHYCHNQAQPDMEDRRPTTCTHRISSLPATVQCTLVSGDPCRGFNVWNACGLPHELTLEVTPSTGTRWRWPDLSCVIFVVWALAVSYHRQHMYSNADTDTDTDTDAA